MKTVVYIINLEAWKKAQGQSLQICTLLCFALLFYNTLAISTDEISNNNNIYKFLGVFAFRTRFEFSKKIPPDP